MIEPMGRSNIFLVGMMGAGKTTLGRLLAFRMGLEFVDTDRIMVERSGATIATLFEVEGEEAFRRRETATLQELAEGDGRVIATGGGAVLAAANREIMRSHGTVIYLRARLESLWHRTRHDTTRPLLATADPKGTLKRLLNERDPLYREVAHLIVDTGSQSATTLASRVATLLRERTSGASA